jgi:ABC-2 type transport system permease protein
VTALSWGGGLTGPGSTLWLVRHDLRLAGRALRSAGRRKRRIVSGVLLSVVVLLHLVGFAAAPFLARMHDVARPGTLLVGSIALGGAFTLFLSKAITEATDSLFQRGDLDLLLSSPLPMRRVLTSRLLAIAINAGFLPLLLVLPLVNGMVLRGEFAWVGLYPVQICLSLIAASLGAGLTFGLLATVGPRWTRIAARALATLFGAASFFATQARLLLPEQMRTRAWDTLLPGTMPAGPQWWPARAALGDAGPMLVLLAIAVVGVVGVSAALGQAYGAGVMSNLALPRATRTGGVARRFGATPFGALLHKEWRLLLRHPGLGAQLFYQFFFLLPGALALRDVHANGWHSSAGVVFLTAMMTGRITKVIATGPFEGDQAATLALSAPVTPARVVRAKLVVTAAALSAIGGLPIVAIGLQLAPAFPAALVASTAAAGTRMWLAVTHPVPRRSPLAHTRLQASTDGLLGVMLDVGWGLVGAVLSLLI